jgi:hypothetical protein
MTDPRTPLTVALGLRWGDTDQYRHVNNVAGARLAEEARIRLFGLPEKPEHFPPGPPPVLAVLGTDTFTMVVGQRLEYTAELPYAAQDVIAEGWISRLGSRAVTMDFRVGALPGGGPGGGGAPVYFLARVTVVIMDLATRAPRPLTDAEVAHLDGYRAEPLTFRD